MLASAVWNERWRVGEEKRRLRVDMRENVENVVEGKKEREEGTHRITPFSHKFLSVLCKRKS